MFACSEDCRPCSPESLPAEIADGRARLLEIAEEADRLIAVQRQWVERQRSSKDGNPDVTPVYNQVLGIPSDPNVDLLELPPSLLTGKAAMRVVWDPKIAKTQSETTCQGNVALPPAACGKEAEDEKQAAEERARRARDEAVTQQLIEAQKVVERKSMVRDFLRDEGFDDVNSGRRKLFRTTYPLHVAAKYANHKLVGLLITEGADMHKLDSRGRTPADMARKKDWQGSHAAVLRALGEKPAAAEGGLDEKLAEGKPEAKATAGGA